MDNITHALLQFLCCYFYVDIVNMIRTKLSFMISMYSKLHANKIHRKKVLAKTMCACRSSTGQTPTVHIGAVYKIEVKVIFAVVKYMVQYIL